MNELAIYKRYLPFHETCNICDALNDALQVLFT